MTAFVRIEVAAFAAWAVYAFVGGLGQVGTAFGQILLAAMVLGTAYLNKRKVAEVHVLVNSQKTALENRIGVLENALSLERGEDVKPGSTVTVEQKSET
jgi:hypothetical protein